MAQAVQLPANYLSQPTMKCKGDELASPFNGGTRQEAVDACVVACDGRDDCVGVMYQTEGESAPHTCSMKERMADCKKISPNDVSWKRGGMMTGCR